MDEQEKRHVKQLIATELELIWMKYRHSDELVAKMAAYIEWLQRDDGQPFDEELFQAGSPGENFGKDPARHV